MSIARQLAENVWADRAVIVTSATMPSTINRDIGLGVSTEAAGEPVDVARIVVPSPFDFKNNSILYVAKHLPNPRNRDQWEPKAIAECVAAVNISGGGALVLTTATGDIDKYANPLVRAGYRVLRQGQMAKGELVAEFAADENSVLVATRSFWQGVDVPGSTCRMVVITRLPMPRPDDPMISARRERVANRHKAGGLDQRTAEIQAFRSVDVPLAATALAQGAGRLIRSVTDRGAVVVLDPRLATAGYRARLLADIPMPRSVSLTEVEAKYRAWGRRPIRRAS
jgi:ATP-dependent DNA helicase DinG